MRTQSLMFKNILASIGVNDYLHIQDVPIIPYLANISTTSASNKKPSPTHEHLHRIFLLKNQRKQLFRKRNI